MMTWVYAAFLLLVAIFFLQATGTFPENPTDADPRMVEFGLGMLVIIGLLAFRLGIWAKGALSGFQPQQVIAYTAKTPFQVMRETYTSAGLIIVSFTIFILLMLEISGHHEEVVQLTEFLQSKGERLINALLH